MSDFNRNHFENKIKYPWEFRDVNISPRSQVTLEKTYRLPDTILPTQVDLDVLKIRYKLQVNVFVNYYQINDMSNYASITNLFFSYTVEKVVVNNAINQFCCFMYPVRVETDILIGS